MALINKERLHQYLNLNYNVLFKGEHGVGKTTVIMEIFKEAGLRCLYLSGSTLDPWVDFVGIPKIRERDGGTPCIEMIRPAALADDSVDVVFIDELNRAPDKVVNAIMELIQFKSINGHRLKNLRVVWGAINPEDDEGTYTVNHLDPAHLDRFHVHIEVPFKVDDEYFKKKYPSVGQIFIDWWSGIPPEIQKSVSPRRLDYAAEAFLNGCRIEDFLPIKSNPKKLRDMLKLIPFAEQVKAIADPDEAAKFLQNVNNATKLLEMIKDGDSIAINFFKNHGQGLPKELTAPFVDWLTAKKNGFEVVSSVEEMIEKLPEDKGTQYTAAMINNVDLSILYQNGGSLENDLRTLNITKSNLVRKLANRVTDVLINCQTRTLDRLFWGIDKTQQKRTNFMVIVKVLSTIDRCFSVRQKQVINNKLYNGKIINIEHFL